MIMKNSDNKEKNCLQSSRSCCDFKMKLNFETPLTMSRSTPFLNYKDYCISNDEPVFRYASPSASSISSCFFYDQSFFDSMGRNNSAKVEKSSIKVKKSNFLKRLFKKKPKNDPVPSKVAPSNMTLNTSNNYLEPIYFNDTSRYLQQKKLSSKASSSADSNESNESSRQNSVSTTKLTITDELNRTKLVAKSNPDLSVENYKNMVETTVKGLQSVQELMVENLKQFYDRGKQLDNLEEKANELQRESSFLQLTTTRVKSSKLRNLNRLKYIMGFMLFIVVILLVQIFISYKPRIQHM